MKDKNNHVLSVDSDVLQNQTDALHAVKRASTLSKTLSESKAKQPANLERDNLLEKTKKVAAAARKPQPVPEATQPQIPEPTPVEAEGTPEKSEVAAPTAKKPAEDSVAVPRFNLAERILAEQRRFASERRRKAGPGGAAGSYAADDTLGAVIREVKDNMARPLGTAASADGDNPTVCGTGGETADAAAQKLLIADIVAREIAALCGRRRRDSLNR